MSAAISPPPAPESATPVRPKILVRPGRLRDVGALARIYRSQSEESRALYHPFPFDRLRLWAIFSFMVVTRRLLPRLLRQRPRKALVLLVACLPDQASPIGYGNVAFFPREGQPVRAIFGYIVAEAYRGLGVGTRLHEDMIDAAVALGVTRGGGMLVSTNVSNLKVLQKLGFEIRESAVVDRVVPGVANYETDGDLVAISRRRHEMAQSR